MINLLPPDIKKSILYARRNTELLKWITTSLVVIGGLMAVVVAGHFYINKSINLISQDVTQSEANLKVQHLSEAEAHVQEISNQVKLVVQVLQREILFSKLLKQIGSAMPKDTALSELDISKVQGGLDLQATAKDAKAATQIQINLQDKNNKIFDKADINDIKCDGSSGETLYPCTVSLRALFGTNSQFYFIQKKDGATQ